MFVYGSHSARRPALPAPTSSRSVQVHPTERTHERQEDRRGPATSERRGRRRTDAPVEPAVARITSATGVQLQADFPHPRRGLRADASERARYARAYDNAQSLSAPAPKRGQERSA
ncbi:MAG: hypothetical protein CMH91_02585 [Oceanicaulis sp.]|uniref:hypothetical protein n=1 Tax=unclassified Oceanicaulis TaxID=2632123 RepID=UPI000C645D12|nr:MULTISPECIES: hypothetical protein [unclassified Oceanicaulis]MAB68810.1 hypothetical protein [Oceanicaulis sp.]MBC37933.1 hypothetical protein [Oceanicaulis sp.]MBG34692.1 hypothetical protein [Oceanicaulis sp.]HBU61523.1 hypothetical protein [Oceanicaulis sp.]